LSNENAEEKGEQGDKAMLDVTSKSKDPISLKSEMR